MALLNFLQGIITVGHLLLAYSLTWALFMYNTYRISQSEETTRDSSVGRAEDCRRYMLTVILRSMVRIRLARVSLFQNF